MTYNDYIIKLTDTMKIRSTNYRLTQSDITIMANNIYEEIALECAIDFFRQTVVIDKTIDTYDLDSLYVTIGKEIPLSVISIKDHNGDSLDKVCREVGSNVFRFSKFIDESINEAILDYLDGETIVFNRQVIPDIESLSTKIQTLIFNAVIEGIMWYTHDSIPNPTASNSPAQETNVHYQRYSDAKKLLKNNLPQRI